MSKLRDGFSERGLGTFAVEYTFSANQSGLLTSSNTMLS